MYQQSQFEIRCEWGAKGIEILAPSTDVFIIVDVLSFSTCVSVAVHNGAQIYPFYSESVKAESFAEEKNALLAIKGRSREQYSLAPSSLKNIPANTKLVLPSPNGSFLSTLTQPIPCFAACLRNAKAVAVAAQKIGKRISVIPAGERWFTDFSLRPALEDWLGAGAVIHSLQGQKSMESQAAESTFLQFENKLHECLQNIESGRELIDAGYGDDVELAAELNVSGIAPRLIEGVYQQG